ncbi:uncharacterized protein LOC144444815 [Glandiceps talaboti]
MVIVWWFSVVIMYAFCGLSHANSIGNGNDEVPRYCHEMQAMLESVRNEGSGYMFADMDVQCQKDGSFESMQCSFGVCSCITPYGNLIARTFTPANRDPPICKDLKPGQCPWSRSVDSCNIKCISDAECPSDHKCCDTDCGKTCVAPVQECYPSEFACSDGLTCVPEIYICDGFPDCPNGEDELTCTAPRFECEFGRMIPMSDKCDGIPQCLNKADEENCEDYDEKTFDCPAPNGDSTIPERLVCNGYEDCTDNSDEIGCACDKPTQTMCANGRCAFKHDICDGDNDCGDWSDEDGCVLVSCDNGVLIPEKDLCNGDDNCGDNSDEVDCNNKNIQCQDTFTARCNSGECIQLWNFCDKVNHCTDHSDEENCPCEFDCGDGSCERAWSRCDGYSQCENGADELDCPCEEPRLYCDGRCLTEYSLCDGYRDCESGSDEMNCPCNEEDGKFMCDNGVCMADYNKCDFQDDCGDMSDENNCGHFVCDNGQLTYGNYRCDGGNDCDDGSDEVGCPCGRYEFECGDGTCIGRYYRCDGSNDCEDGSDEDTTLCADFVCDNGESVYWAFECDGYFNCEDHSDEIHCECYENEFKCDSGLCTSTYNICDQMDDCGDNSDEKDCEWYVCDDGEKLSPGDISCDGYFHCDDQSDEAGYRCPCEATDSKWRCDNGECIHEYSKCSGYDDCGDNSDERDCEKYTCKDGEEVVISPENEQGIECDGKADCMDMSDELNCECRAYQFPCANTRCVESYERCNGYDGCGDMSDEADCAGTKSSLSTYIIGKLSTANHYEGHLI